MAARGVSQRAPWPRGSNPQYAMSWRFEQADRCLGAAFLICERRKVRIRDFLGPSEHSDVGAAKPPV